VKQVPYFPPDIESLSFRTSHCGYAWQKNDLGKVFACCLQAGIAISAGEAWVVKRITDCAPDEPTESKHNVAPGYNQRLAVLTRTQEYVAWGIFPLNNGKAGVLAWSTKRSRWRTWQGHVKNTIKSSLAAVAKGNLESEIEAGLSGRIFYNLRFELKDGSEF
jgi:hypothetical protein